MKKTPKPLISSDHFFKFVIIFWIVFSVFYIAYDQWKSLKVELIDRAYVKGKTDFVNSVIERAQSCEPFNLYNKTEEKSVDLINIKCLSQEIDDKAAEVSDARVQ